MSNTRNMSKRRFKEFNGVWKQYSLGDLVDIQKGNQKGRNEISENQNSDFPYPVYNGGVNPSGFTDQYNRENEVIISEGGNSAGYVNLVEGKFYSGGHNYSLLNNTTNKHFLYGNLQSRQTDIMRLRVGSGLPNIQIRALKEFKIYVPLKKEQQRIGEFFNNLNKHISLQEEKVEKYKNLKQAYLIKLFPKKDRLVPEMRFAEFAGNWEQRELWELTIWDKNYNEVDSFKQRKIISYKYLLADQLNKLEVINGKVLLLSTGLYKGFTTEELAGNNLHEGEVIAIPWGGTANIKYWKGKFVTADNRIATSNDLKKLKNKYIYYYMNNRIVEISSYYRGASIKHPSMNDVLSMKIIFPSIIEQEKIINFFTILDNLVILNQSKLNKLKEMKKAFLSEMFV